MRILLAITLISSIGLVHSAEAPEPKQEQVDESITKFKQAMAERKAEYNKGYAAGYGACTKFVLQETNRMNNAKNWRGW